ncbi:hypothetical protein ABAC460_03470 [Asticcacaulis sp. AC460]|nr:hypothetical protein ABAC460_03470 [Asticcacaulis sp. AC460]
MDRRAFGVVNFPRPRGKTRMPMEPLTKALQSTLGVRIQAKRKWLFGRKHHSFLFMGEQVQICLLENGDATFDLGLVDDEIRETLLEHLRTSLEFEGR